MGGTYRSVSLLVRGPLTTGWYHQKSTVGGRLREIGEKGKKKKKKNKKKKKKKKKKRRNRTSTVVARAPSLAPRRRPRVARALSPSALAGDFSLARGDGTSPRVGRKIEG
ncbi:hypothetical protein BHE74_00013555 [Ensete ventricosum]|nr:hypothetical protein BHE74_00013555 [Ensete ventricosum]